MQTAMPPGWHGHSSTIYAIVCDLCQQEGKEPDFCFATALKAVDMVFGKQLPNRPKFLALLEQLSQKPEQIPELDLERYHVLQVDLYRDQPDYDHDVMLRLKRNCNYYLLAEHDAAKCSSLWDTTKVWRGARDKYYDIGDDANARRCCLRLDALLSHSDDPELLSWQLEHYERLSEIELRLGNLPGMYQCLNSLYPFWCRPPVQEDSAEVVGAVAGAVKGSSVGIAMGPAGAIAGTIPGAIIGGAMGLLAGNNVGHRIDSGR